MAHQNSKVLEDPAPRILFMGFGDSALNFEVRVYVGTIDHYLSTVDEITGAIDQEFRKVGIEIAFPQRDIHVRSFRGPLPITSEMAEAEPPPPSDAD